MRQILLLMVWQFALLAGSRLFADIVTLNDGRQISGLVGSGNIRELHIKVGNQSQAIDIHQVQSIQLGVSSPAAQTAPPDPASAQPNSLILKDGTRVAGKWWAIDDTDIHFLVNNELQHYPRPDILAVTFGPATLPPLPALPQPPATSAQSPASARRPAPAPTAARSPASSLPQSPTSAPSGSPPAAAGAPPAAAPRGVSQPEEIGMVYFWNGRALYALERNQAVEHRSSSAEYWEIPGAQSRIRVDEASSLVFVLRLAKGVDPASYALFALVTANGARRTRSDPDRKGGLVTWPVDIEVNYASNLMTYALRVRDLPAGEYSFSPTNTNDAYCFAVDPAASGQ